jgi:hypothetical protein
MSKIGMGMPTSQSKIQPLAPASLIFFAKRILYSSPFFLLHRCSQAKRASPITDHKSEVTRQRSLPRIDRGPATCLFAWPTDN